MEQRIKIGGGIIVGSGFETGFNKLLNKMSEICDEIFIINNDY